MAEEELRVAGEAKKRVDEAFRAAEENVRFSKRAGGRGGGALLSRSLPVAAASPRGRGFVRGAGRGGSGAGRGASFSPAPSTSFCRGRGSLRGGRGSWAPGGGNLSLPHPLNSTPAPTFASTPRARHPHRGSRDSSSPHVVSHTLQQPPLAPSPAVSSQGPPSDVRGIVEEVMKALAPALAAGGLSASVAASPVPGPSSGGAVGGGERPISHQDSREASSRVSASRGRSSGASPASRSRASASSSAPASGARKEYPRRH